MLLLSCVLVIIVRPVYLFLFFRIIVLYLVRQIFMLFFSLNYHTIICK